MEQFIFGGSTSRKLMGSWSLKSQGTGQGRKSEGRHGKLTNVGLETWLMETRCHDPVAERMSECTNVSLDHFGDI